MRDTRLDKTMVLKKIKEAANLNTKAALNNELAVRVMGWHLQSKDSANLWRDDDGEPVRIKVGYQTYTLCAPPWREESNRKLHLSFNPVLNHHKNLIDFEALLLAQLN